MACTPARAVTQRDRLEDVVHTQRPSCQIECVLERKQIGSGVPRHSAALVVQKEWRTDQVHDLSQDLASWAGLRFLGRFVVPVARLAVVIGRYSGPARDG